MSEVPLYMESARLGALRTCLQVLGRPHRNARYSHGRRHVSLGFRAGGYTTLRRIEGIRQHVWRPGAGGGGPHHFAGACDAKVAALQAAQDSYLIKEINTC